MKVRLIEWYLGRVILALGGLMGVALIVAAYCGEPSLLPIVSSMLITLSLGAAMAFHGRRKGKLSIREGSLLVAAVWFGCSFLAALPLWLSGSVPTFIDAFFESTAGLTATGASLITDLEVLPKSILLWRSLSQWLGGMGIVVLVIIFLPHLGIGALNLFRAEAPGAVKERVLPRLRDTAITLWGIYTGLTLLEIALLWAFGMPLFDAVNHGLSTLATGGFSTRNDSLIHYNAWAIEVVILCFMVIAGGNFSLYIEAWRKKSLKVLNDLELKAYLGILATAALILTLVLYASQTFPIGDALRYASFQVVSINTGTGFVTADYDQWPPLGRLLLFLLMFVGGMAGSTTGGIKVARLVVLLRISWAELKRIIHPHMTISAKIGGKPIDPLQLNAVARFFFLYVLIFILGSLAMTAVGLQPFEAMGATAASLGNVGPAFGIVGPMANYAAIPEVGKLVLALCMLLGRLELFTVLMLLHPDFWRSRHNW